MLYIFTLLSSIEFFLVTMPFFYDIVCYCRFSPGKPYVFVSLPLKSACPHGIVSGFCALCFCQPYIILNSIANCTHTFVILPVKSHNLGILCDFGGGTHIAVTSIASIVHTCPLCNAILCSGCFAG
jgi:hypothetical protein